MSAEQKSLPVGDVDSIIEASERDWTEVSEEYRILQDIHQEYITKLEELSELQGRCEKELKHQRYRLGQIKSSLKKVKGSESNERRENLEKDIMRREAQLTKVQGSLPQPNGRYLSVILGSVNVSIINRDHKFRYKEEYEKFKLTVTVIALVIATIGLFTNYRVLDLAFTFLLVWYYCTLTIRESILIVNGSRIKGWWRTHHFLSTAIAGILLIWPDGEPYQLFRRLFMAFNVYIGIVQYLQYQYQRGCLYRLHSLGYRPTMDITIEGFHSWMWMGLSFLLPFLYIGYFFQLYLSYTLYVLSGHPEAPWQVKKHSGFFNSYTPLSAGALRYRYTLIRLYTG
ncbi:unnamed protein product [Darwinula stevensoni]|uniref:Transmembrane protein 120A n=1 Tax=Darwinula stevensoni TaxID=69355 RepID=A0A7R8XB31_9CRUS|nr:unnamed protein product [Darwinula stevensoni]CAG0884417.1 unnamed protein product [Darwinula stevensoni]